MSSNDRDDYNPAQHARLLAVARQSVEHGLIFHRELEIAAEETDPELLEKRASFVTLLRNHELRGCIGTLESYQPLIQDVAHNAYAAAFSDPRFPPVERSELDNLTIHISILTPPQPMAVVSEQDLLTQLVPNEDGLILQDGRRRSTFLPSVWESLPTPREFVGHLKLKAGLPSNHWSDTIRFQRYRTIVIE
ncbi:MAG: AmmeMemoRadiSam system protein A [Pseudomonadota bacterium]